MFLHILLVLRDTILETWFGKKWKRLKNFWGWKICLIYAYFFKHLNNLSILVSFTLIKKRVYFIRFDVNLVQQIQIVKNSLYSSHKDKGTMVKFRTNYWSKLHDFTFFGSSRQELSSIEFFWKYFENNWKIIVNELNICKTFHLWRLKFENNWRIIANELNFCKTFHLWRLKFHNKSSFSGVVCST